MFVCVRFLLCDHALCYDVMSLLIWQEGSCQWTSFHDQTRISKKSLWSGYRLISHALFNDMDLGVPWYRIAGNFQNFAEKPSQIATKPQRFLPQKFPAIRQLAVTFWSYSSNVGQQLPEDCQSMISWGHKLVKWSIQSLAVWVVSLVPSGV